MDRVVGEGVLREVYGGDDVYCRGRMNLGLMRDRDMSGVRGVR